MSSSSRVRTRKQRLATLLLAEQLGSVVKACRQARISRSTFYEWKERFREMGAQGLDPLPPIPRAHPQTTAKRVEEQINQLALAHPESGCDRIGELLPEDAPQVSSTTIQKILNKSGIGKRTDRWLALEKLALEQPNRLSGEQRKFVSGRNPCFPECTYERRRPGDVLQAGIWHLGKSESGNQVSILVAVDAHCAHAFGEIFEGVSAPHIVPHFGIRIDRFYRKRHLTVKKIHIADGFGFERVGLYSSGGSLSIVGAFIGALAPPQTERPCCLLRFRHIAMEEFARGSRRKKIDLNVAVMNRGFQEWMNHYNWRRPHEGYPNWGKIPAHPFG